MKKVFKLIDHVGRRRAFGWPLEDYFFSALSSCVFFFAVGYLIWPIRSVDTTLGMALMTIAPILLGWSIWFGFTLIVDLVKSQKSLDARPNHSSRKSYPPRTE